jgi:hypothetical protein
MKNLKYLAGIVLILTTFTFTSCDNEPIDPEIDLGNPTGGGNPANALFRADFSGNTWNAATAQAVISGNMIQIGALKANGESFAFLIDGSTTGTYPANENILNFNPAGSEYGYWSMNMDNPAENTGSITITNINTANKTISGTFNFKGYWSDTTVTNILPTVFTNGVFQNVPYINQVETGDTFYAKVNGIEFNDVDILAAEIGIGGQDFISIAAQDASFNSMTVSVRDNLGAGTYPITGNIAADVVQASYTFDDEDFSATSGSVTIISKTATKIKGTFNFVTSTFNVTQGAFEVEY